MGYVTFSLKICMKLLGRSFFNYHDGNE